MIKNALVSSCGTYRYWLTRVWDEQRPSCVWIMLNPSTADAQVDDPTIRRIIGFSKCWGWGGAAVYNLFALRSPVPTALRQHADPVGPDNDRYLLQVPRGVEVVAGWGEGGDLHGRAAHVQSMLADAGIRLRCLGRNKSGSPKHPLYVPGSAELVAFPG